FRGEARISTWLYRIAVREALRHKGRHSATDLPLTFETDTSQMSNPALNRERAELLNIALGRLSADHSTVLAMSALEGLSHDEIATVLKIPTGTVWSRLHNARKKLADEIELLEKQPRSGSARSAGQGMAQVKGA